MYTNSMSCEFELTVTPPPPVVCVAVMGHRAGHREPCSGPPPGRPSAGLTSSGGSYGTVIVRPYPYAAGIGGAAAGGGV